MKLCTRLMATALAVVTAAGEATFATNSACDNSCNSRAHTLPVSLPVEPTGLRLNMRNDSELYETNLESKRAYNWIVSTESYRNTDKCDSTGIGECKGTIINNTIASTNDTLGEVDSFIDATVESIDHAEDVMKDEIEFSPVALCMRKDSELYDTNAELAHAYNRYWSTESFQYTDKIDSTGVSEYKGMIMYDTDALSAYEAACNDIEGATWWSAEPATFDCKYNSKSSGIMINETNYGVCAPDTKECKDVAYGYLEFEQVVISLFANIGVYCGKDLPIVLCNGMHSDDYCDCGGDCVNYPDYCSCAEAQACCQDFEMMLEPIKHF